MRARNVRALSSAVVVVAQVEMRSVRVLQGSAKELETVLDRPGSLLALVPRSMPTPCLSNVVDVPRPILASETNLSGKVVKSHNSIRDIAIIDIAIQ
jgi:hypothetical protein